MDTGSAASHAAIVARGYGIPAVIAYAAGVVMDTGSAASHAAIVARGYGIPAVMGASGATERIADGQEILVDGTEGRVKLLQKRDTGAAIGRSAQAPGT